MKDQDIISEEERHEAAIEESSAVPQHLPTHLPSGFDGVEPAPSTEAKAKLEDSITRMREKLSKIADIALAADAKCVNIEQLGNRWLECDKAICEIRKTCGLSLAKRISGSETITPREKPIDPTAPEMADKAAKQKEYFRKNFSFCDGLFPIIHVGTQEGFMAFCKINGRMFKESVIQEDVACEDVKTWNGYIYDKGACVCMVSGMGKGKTAVQLMTHAAFMAYVKQLSGGGKKYHNRKGFLRQNAARAKAAKKEVA